MVMKSTGAGTPVRDDTSSPRVSIVNPTPLCVAFGSLTKPWIYGSKVRKQWGNICARGKSMCAWNIWVSHYIYQATQRYMTIYVTASYLLFFLLARNLLNLSFARLLLASW